MSPQPTNQDPATTPIPAPEPTRFHVQLRGEHTFTPDDIWGFDQAYEGGGMEAFKELIMEDWTSFLEEFVAEGGTLTDLFIITPIDDSGATAASKEATTDEPR